MIELDDYQLDAIRRMKNGCILCGGVGSGKTRTALSYYYIQNGGSLNPFTKMKKPKDLYIITTARKRDTGDWEKEMLPFRISTEEPKIYSHIVVVDSWNNIKKYNNVHGAFFIFDEQRVVGRGAWVKSFLRIANRNEWILLSATPGDKWEDYVPVFIANGFYKHRSEFEREHVVYSRFTKYPQIVRYTSEGRLIRLRNQILVKMNYIRDRVSIHNNVITDYDRDLYSQVERTRQNPEDGLPIENASEYCQILRRICNSDVSRADKVRNIVRSAKRAIIFYNYNYELDILKSIDYGKNFVVAEYNGKVHGEVPESDCWVYLVQYNAGNEAWNCITTDTIIFYSENYSYRIMTQAAGRIDRRNSPYDTLIYYHMKTQSKIDNRISNALKTKKKFNETDFFVSNKFAKNSTTV